MANEKLGITREQFDRLEALFAWDEEAFVQLLEDYTGLTSRKITVFQIFDGCFDDIYIGNTHDDMVSDILRRAGIEVIEDGK